MTCTSAHHPLGHHGYIPRPQERGLLHPMEDGCYVHNGHLDHGHPEDAIKTYYSTDPHPHRQMQMANANQDILIHMATVYDVHILLLIPKGTPLGPRRGVILLP